ncbi:MAG: thymidylate synthase [bacterium]|nr:thymidylate synthase [bacterium]
MKAYNDLVTHVINNGTRKENRTGVDTISTFNYNYELGFGKDNLYNHDNPGYQHNYYHLNDGFPLLTTKKISWKNIVIEMLWFLSGSIDIEILKRHNCKFWDHWADENGKVPSAYGHFWTSFPSSRALGSGENQIQFCLDTLRKAPMSRRLVVVAWDPANAQVSKLPPCHFAFLFNVQMDHDGEQRLCLHLTQRSCDVALGVPYNIASYALLLMLFSKMTGIKPGIFAHTLCDAHIYTNKPDGSMSEYNHLDGLSLQLERIPKSLPKLHLDDSIKDLADIQNLMSSDVLTQDILNKICLSDYNPHGSLKFKVAV